MHHGGVLPSLRELTEELFQVTLVRVLFATETRQVISLVANPELDDLDKGDFIIGGMNGRNVSYHTRATHTFHADQDANIYGRLFAFQLECILS